MRTPYPYYRYPEDLDADRRARFVDTLIRGLIALGLFFAGVVAALWVTP